MASLIRNGAVGAQSLTASMRTLSLTASSIRPITATWQTRCFSQALLTSPARRQASLPSNSTSAHTCATAKTSLPTWLASAQSQQTRGMKVHSSVKKRCEHCKVREMSAGHYQLHGELLEYERKGSWLTGEWAGRTAKG